MNLSLEQAKKALGNTGENPAVGCIITRHNNVISAGYTSPSGKPHAEYNAINFSKIKTSDSNLYVTLEPCSHFGKTPPCVRNIIRNKIKRVFFSIYDPDPRSFKKCEKILRLKKIIIIKGSLKNEVNLFYRSYLKFKKKDLPFVTCKLAVSKDFYTIDKRKKWITNEFSRGRVHLMRSLHDCVITSSKTVIKDNPSLTCRIDGLKDRSPSRIILDKEFKIPTNSKIIKESSYFSTIIFYNKINKRKIELLKRLKVKFYKIPLDNSNNLDLKKTLIKAKKLGFSRIFIESGIKLTTNLLNMDLVDDFKLFISNKNLRSNGSGNIKKYLKSFLYKKKKIVYKVNLFGEKLMSYKLK